MIYDPNFCLIYRKLQLMEKPFIHNLYRRHEDLLEIQQIIHCGFEIEHKDCFIRVVIRFYKFKKG
jgi:hypothetical protein